MPQLSSHQSTSATKMLLIGESGSGKTGALVSLVEAGYNLRILDFDNGLDVILGIINKKYPEESKRKELLDKIVFETLTDKLKNVGGKIVTDGAPQAFNIAMQLLDCWKRGGIDLGKVESWGENDVLIIDSLTFLSKAIMRHVLFLNGRGTAHPQIQDWGAAMEVVEGLLGLLYSTNIKCNVIITSHISYIELDNGMNKGYPSTLGNKLPPKVGRYFNSLLMVKTKGSGSGLQRVIRTVTDSNIDLKTSIPGVLPDELPISTGLADFFKAQRGGKTPQETGKSGNT